MPTTKKQVYADSSVYVATFLGPAEPDFEIAQAALLAAEQGITVGWVSGLVMAEVVGAPRIRVLNSKAEKDEWMSRMIDVRVYFETTDFTYIEESRRAGVRAMQIAVDHGLKGPDALHVALAEGAGVDEFYTLDAKQLRIGDSLSHMRVMKPHGDPQSAFAI